MLRRLSVLTILTGFAALTLAGALTYFLSSTEAGLRFIVGQLPEQIGTVTLRIEGASGALRSGVQIERFQLEHHRVLIDATGVSGRVNILPLLWQTIDARDVRVESARVEIRRSDKPPRKPPRFLPRFLTITTDNLRVRNGELTLINGYVMNFTNVGASGVARHRTIRFTDVRGNWEDLNVAGAALLTAASPLLLEATARAELRQPGQPLWTIAVDAAGNLDSLPATVVFTAPFQARVVGEALDLTRGWNWRGQASITDFDLRAWNAGGALGRITGDLAVRGDRAGFSAEGVVASAGLDVGDFNLLFDGSYAARTVTADRIRLLHRRSGSELLARGTIGVVSNGPELGLSGSWSDFHWPLDSTDPVVRSPSGRFTLDETWPYRLSASGNVLPAILADPLPLTLRARLHRDHLEIVESSIGILDGTGQLAGEVRWAPDESWSLGGRVENLNPGKVRRELPGRVSFNLNATGAGFTPAARVGVEISQMTGQLRDAPARGSGRVTRTADRWDFENVKLTNGELRLALDGMLDSDRRNLRFELNADNLGIIAPGSRGRIRARGALSGTVAAPALQLSATAANIELYGIEMRALNANVDLDPRPGQAFDVQLDIRDVRAFDRRIKSILVSMSGTSERHALKLDADALNVRLAAAADGGFNDGAWRGTWKRFDLDDDDDLNLELASPAETEVSFSAARQNPLCLQGQSARICAEGIWTPAQWSAAIEAAQLPMIALTAGLTPGVRYDGVLNITANVASAPGGIPLGQMDVELTDAALRRRRANGREDVIQLGSGVINARAEPERLRAVIKLEAGTIGTIEGEAMLPRTEAALLERPLRGRLDASTTALGFVNIYVPEIDRAAGRLITDLAISGTLGAPLVSGTLRLTGGELDFYQVNLLLREVELQARLLDNGIDFGSSAKAGNGTLNATGTLNWRDGQPRGELKIEGSDLLITNVPEARITASPQLRFTIDGRSINATGEVTIPRARIAPADLTGAVLTSADEVLVGAPPRDPDTAWQVTSNIRLVLGEDVQLETFGLSGRLTGSLTGQTDIDGVARGTGELSVANGKYAALGRQLDIERGRLIFSGGLLSDPAIDIRAQKQFPEVTAGVNVRGTLREPRLTFFSQPSLPQSQIVSLILAGGSLEGAQGTGRSGAARDAVLAQGGAIIAQQLGSRLGIEDVGIEQGLDNTTSLVLGKYLSPRLYISYGISLAESINTVKMRYTLGDRWTIRTEAGTEQSAELVYTIEK